MQGFIPLPIPPPGEYYNKNSFEMFIKTLFKHLHKNK